MKKISFVFDEQGKINGYINCIDFNEYESLVAKVKKGLSCSSKVELQRCERDFIDDKFFNNVERFVLINNLNVDENGTLTGETYQGAARLVSTIFSMLAKKNKSELDYRDILDQKGILKQELDNPKTVERIELHLETVVVPELKTFDFSSTAMLALLIEKDFPIGSFCASGQVKDYLKTLRDAHGTIITDGYRSVLEDELEEPLTSINYYKCKSFLKSRFAEIIDKYGLVDNPGDCSTVIGIINTILELNRQYKLKLPYAGVYKLYNCGASYDVSK